MITPDQLTRIAPSMPAERASKYHPHLTAAMSEFEINTPLRAAAFLAQILHESGAFRWMEEIWGPTAAQSRYEPPGKKARDLGNTQTGDGHRFKGRGPIQLTGRANYARYGRELGVDLINNPPLAATPEVAFRIAGLYWRKNGLNELADKQWFKTITKRINGGFNGLADRVNYYNRAKLALGVRSMTRGGSGGTQPEETEDAEEDDRATKRFPRGLDEPGEITPRAAERNAGKKSGGKKTGAKKSSAESSATKKAGATKKAAKRTNVKRATRRALCIGINDYPYEGNDLHGCVNDAHAWAKVLTEQFDFATTDIKIILDRDATKRNTIRALKDLLAGAQTGDTLVFANSSHGSYVAERGGDEEIYDEVLCPYDIDSNDISDDELREFIAGLKPGVRLTVILDNCHSGTATRAAITDILPGLHSPDRRRVRFLSPALRGLPVLINPWKAKPKRKIGHPQSKMKEILLSGCTDKEYSYDAYFNDVPHGALTYYTLEAMRRARYKLSYADLHTRLVRLIKDYPQHPQLEGTSSNKRRQIFA
jgi:metacaspase-1